MKRLKNIIESFTILSKDYWDYEQLVYSIPFSKDSRKTQTFIDWKVVDNYSSLLYSYVDCEEDIKSRLLSSLLSTNDKIRMMIGRDYPVIELSREDFLNNWYQFARLAQDRFIVWTEDEKLFMEFSYYYDKRLFANFEIDGGETIELRG